MKLSPFHKTTSAFVGAASLLWAQIALAEGSGYNPLPAQMGDFSLKVEPGVAFPMTHPQTEILEIGGGETIKALWVVNDLMDLGPSATFVMLPRGTSGVEAGTAWAFGGSLRVRRARNAPEEFLAISPWVDADMLYVRTGGLDRLGFAVAAGVLLPIGRARVFWIGPFIRYFQILQRNQPNSESTDGKVLSVGLSLEVGPGVERDCSSPDSR